MPLDHLAIYIPQSKFEDLVTFLTTSLDHLGFKEITRPFPTLVGMGETRPYFWMSGVAGDENVGDEKKEEEEERKEKTVIPTANSSTTSLKEMKKDHIAFTAENSKQVQLFHTNALKAGGVCNGPPGLRPQYGPNYYGAFVLDPVCGFNFEVVCRTGE